MATDYDAPRREKEEPQGGEAIEAIAKGNRDQSGKVDVDETEVAENFELPGADLGDEELSVKVVPMQDDEFRCSSCFLVQHRSQYAGDKNGQPICSDCA
ncbi:DUF4193 domain-containing protein [Salininema proteolyticum]|uniref:DUF4193 domain-containing protein n=1 Tax=Salininema proteolyticum TaxID=1607685 RepID=A0ABV8U0Q5_9ACTN